MTDALIKMFTSGAYLPFALLVIYAGLRFVKDETHWLNQGRTAVITAAVLAGLTQLVPILTTGKTPDMQLVVAAVMTAIGLYLHPTQQAAKA